MITVQRIAQFFSPCELLRAPLVNRAILLYMHCVSLEQLHYTRQLRYLQHRHRKIFKVNKKIIRLTGFCTIIQLFRAAEFLWWFGYALRFKERTPEPPLDLGNGGKEKPKRRKGCKLLSNCMLPLYQHSH